MKISTEYQGVTLTNKYLTIHFRLEVGGTIVRASQVKMKVDDLPSEVLLQAVDTMARRKLLEIWSMDQDILPWD